MSCAGMSRLTFPSLQFSYPESDRDRRVAVLVRPLIKRSTAFSSRPRPAMAAAMAEAAVGAKEGRKERKKEQRNGRTNRVIALVLTAVGCTEATVVVIRVGGASAAALFCKVVFRVSLTPFLARPRPARARILYCV